MLDPLGDKLLQVIMKGVFNLVTVDDFVQVEYNPKSKETKLSIGNGKGGVRLLSASEAAEFIDQVRSLDTNDAFKSIIDYYYPPQHESLGKKNIQYKSIYATIVTLLLVITVYILMKLNPEVEKQLG